VEPPLHLMITGEPLPGVPGATVTRTTALEFAPTVPVVGETVTPVFSADQVMRNEVGVPPVLYRTIWFVLGLARLPGQFTATLAGLAEGGGAGTPVDGLPVVEVT